MSVDEYPRPKKEAPNKTKSDQQINDELNMRQDVSDFLKTNEVEQVPGPCKTVAEVLEGNRAKGNLNKTVSHRGNYGSLK